MDLVSLVREGTLEVVESGLTRLPVDSVATEALEEELSTSVVLWMDREPVSEAVAPVLDGLAEEPTPELVPSGESVDSAPEEDSV